MRIGAYVRRAAPDHPAGAEWALHDAMAALADRGHECAIVSELGATRSRIDDVLVYSQPSEADAMQHFVDSEVMLTQLEGVQEAQFLAASYKTPLVHLVHSEHQLEQLGVMASCSALVVFNAAHVERANTWWPGPGTLLRPVIRAERVRTDQPGGSVTLVNLSHQKGGMEFIRIAERLPGVPFFGVQGAYGDQAYGPDGIPGYGDNPSPAPLPANMRASGPLRDIRDALGFARILLVLSATETYGRIAGEAMVSGIPVIARLTPGVAECCGDAVIYEAEERHIAAQVERVYRDADEWQERSRWALARAATNEARNERELDALEAHLDRIVETQPAMIL